MDHSVAGVKMMINEMKMFQLLVTQLEACGCPRDCIVTEWRLDRQQYVDVAVMGPDGKTPVAIFECKSRLTKSGIASAVSSLAKCVATIAIPVWSFVVCAKNEEQIVMASATGVIRGTTTIASLVTTLQAGGEELPSYHLLESGFMSRVAVAQGKEKCQRSITYQNISLGISVGFAVLFLFDYIFHEGELNWQNISILVIAVVVFVLPYYDLISVKEVSLLRRVSDKDQTENEKV